MTSPASMPKASLERLSNGQPRFRGCSRITEYEWLAKLGEGTFGEVSKARSKKTGQVVALKKILMHHEKDGFPITALREIKLLKQLDHVNILKLEEMAIERPKDVKKKPSMFMVTPYMDHDLSGLLENPAVRFTEPQIKCYMKQLLEGTAYLHANKILHRDMKAANLLINNRGILQIADFGLARPYDDEAPQPGKGGGEATREYTTLVVTRWYRPPELLLQLRRYTTAIDMWGVGCVFGEMFKGKPILAGNSDLNQAQMIFDLVGSPSNDNMPGWSELPGCEGVREFAPRPPTLDHVFREQGALTRSLLTELLKLDWRKRINAMDALQHPYFHTHPLPGRPQDLPSFEESHELDRRKFRDQKNKPPPAPAGGSVGVGPQGEWGMNGRPLPQDAHRGGRIPGPRRPYVNGHPRGPLSAHLQNGDYPPNNRFPPPPYENQPYHNRGPPPPQPYDQYSTRPPYPPRSPNYPPDKSYHPRPPAHHPPPVDSNLHRHPPYRDRDDPRGPPALRGRVPPQTRIPDQRPPLGDRPPAPGEVDTYIPSYSTADPTARPPPTYLNKARRDRDEPWGRPDDRRPMGGEGPPLDYSERFPDNGPRVSGMPHDRRRSRSPRDREWDRRSDRGGGGGMHGRVPLPPQQDLYRR